MSFLNIIRALRFYNMLLRHLGILPIKYCPRENKYILQRGWSFHVAHWGWQIVYLVSIGVLVFRREDFFKKGYSEIENNYWNVLISAAMIAQFLTNAWFLTLYRLHFNIISYCMYLMEHLSFTAQRKVGTFQSIMIVAVMGAVTLNTYSMWQEFTEPHSLISICVYLPWIIFQLHYIILSIILSFYLCVIQLITGHLNNIDTTIFTIVKSNYRRKRVTDIDLDNIQECLVAYDKLLLLCTEDISKSYGVVFVLITFISTLDITFIVYILNLITAEGYLQTIESTIQTAFFALPSVIFICMMFLGSDIQKKLMHWQVKLLYNFLVFLKMVPLKYWNMYVLFLRIIGMCPATFSHESKKYVSNMRDLLIAISITTFTFIIMECLLLVTIHFAFSSDLHIYADFKTGNTLFLIQTITATVVQLAESIYIFIYRNTGVEMLNIIYKHCSNFPNGSSVDEFWLDRCFRWCLIFHVLMILAYELNVLTSIWTYGLSTRTTISLSFVLTIRPFICCIVMSAYIYIVFVICNILAHYNNRLQANTIQFIKSKNVLRQKLQEILVLRGDLLALSCNHISQVYGVVMLLETLYILSVLPSFPTFILGMLNWNIPYDIRFFAYSCRASLWVLPPLLILVQAMAINSINGEANNTVRILAKFPRTGTGLDKMVDKFLMKNVRKKPILTAYGFFPLDRSALFKLFTAIIMYIMILVQFTDIENSLKKIN